MHLFFALTQRAFKRQLTYRAAVFAGLFTNFFFGIFRIAILVALYGEKEVVAGVDLQGGITYMILTQAVIGYLSMFSWFEMMNSVYTGEIAADLLKPMNLYTFWLARDLGRAAVQFIFRGVLIILIYLPFFELTSPSSAGQWLAVAIVCVFSLLVSFSWRFLVNLAAFWSPNAVGIARFAYIVSWFFSGFLMPLRYYPDWVIRIANLTPFPYTVNIIMDTYIGVLSGPALTNAILAQASWFLGMAALGQLVLRAGIKRLVILGG